jgi:hypothetical protein
MSRNYKYLFGIVTVLLLVVGLVKLYPIVCSWINRENAKQTQYNATHHQECTDAQIVVQVVPDAGRFGETDGFDVWGNKGGYALSPGYPAPGLNTAYCFGSYIEVQN